MTENPILRHTVKAAVAIGEHILAQLDGTLPAAGQYGYPAYMAAKANENTAVTILGIAQVTAGAAVAAHAELKATAEGKVVAHDGNNVKVGRSLEAAGADGDVIRAIIFAQ